jgi:hypothetical protein
MSVQSIRKAKRPRAVTTLETKLETVILKLENEQLLEMWKLIYAASNKSSPK